ncbi:MAG: ribonuclease HII, partial [Rickettsiales bacterium]|nr:ribonuclease HII [Rickettsiales bacterium]
LREAIFEKLCARACVGVGVASVEEIDQLNILGATKLAMLRAVQALSQEPDVALVDGNQPPMLPCKTVCVVGGDALSLSIAAASIVAKVTRDRMMRQLAAEFPGYGWESNMGYGTRKHYQGMETLGVTPHHRRSFRPVQMALGLIPATKDFPLREEEPA